MRHLADLADATGSAAYRAYLTKQADSIWTTTATPSTGSASAGRAPAPNQVGLAHPGQRPRRARRPRTACDPPRRPGDGQLGRTHPSYAHRRKEAPMKPRTTRRPAALLTALLAILWGLIAAPPAATAAPSAPGDTARRHRDTAHRRRGTFRNPLNTGPGPYLTVLERKLLPDHHAGRPHPDVALLLAGHPARRRPHHGAGRITDPSATSTSGHRSSTASATAGTSTTPPTTGGRPPPALRPGVGPRRSGRPLPLQGQLTPPNHATDFAIDPGILQHNGRALPRLQRHQPVPAQRHQHRPDANPYTVSGNASPSTRPAAAPRYARAPSSSTATAAPG